MHWIRFRFTPDGIAAFQSGESKAVLAIAHPNYGHMAAIPPAMRAELAKDFA